LRRFRCHFEGVWLILTKPAVSSNGQFTFIQGIFQTNHYPGMDWTCSAPFCSWISGKRFIHLSVIMTFCLKIDSAVGSIPWDVSQTFWRFDPTRLLVSWSSSPIHITLHMLWQFSDGLDWKFRDSGEGQE
jgi:hypothetical protein